MLVLDEPTSALDEETEAGVLATLRTLRREGRTIIVIAHRHSTIAHCDMIARLDQGRLVKFGPMNETPSAPRKGRSGRATAQRR